MYIYKFICSAPACGREFKEERDTPYLRKPVRKLCKYCSKGAKAAWVEDQGGFASGGCGTCIHFVEAHHGWGTCGLGHENELESEYTVGEVYGLVYEEDVCPDREVANEQA